MEVYFTRDGVGNVVIHFSEPVKLTDWAPEGITPLGTTGDGKPITRILENVNTLTIQKDRLK